MSRTRVTNKKAALAMVASMLLASLLRGVMSSLDSRILPQGSQALPFGLPDMIAGHALVPFALFMGMGLGGLLLVLLPPSLPRLQTLMAGLLVLVLANLMTAFSDSIFEVAGWRFLAGIGWSMHFCAWISIGATYFPRHRAMVVGCMIFVVGVGSIIAPLLNGVLSGAGSWRVQLQWLVGVPILAFLFLLIMRLFEGASAQAKRHVIVPDTAGVALSLWTFGPLALALASLCIAVAAYGMLISYVVYLREVQGFSVKAAMMFGSVSVLTSFLSPVGGWLGDRYGTSRVLLTTLPITGVIGALMYAGWRLPLPAQVALSLLVGLGLHAVLYVNCLVAMIKSLAPAQGMRATGLFAAAFSLSVPFAQVAFLYLQRHAGWLGAALLQITGCLLLAAVLVWLAQRTLRHGETT